MRLLLDQDVYAVTARFLVELGHDVVTAADLGRSQSSDADLLRAAHDQNRVFVTRDKDFGSLVFIGDFEAGVIFLRLTLSNIHTVHQELARVLTLYAENQLKDAFVVVEAGRHRFRKLAR
jgi:predicted nuclease of predicted toxin-antitoxin system